MLKGELHREKELGSRPLSFCGTQKDGQAGFFLKRKKCRGGCAAFYMARLQLQEGVAVSSGRLAVAPAGEPGRITGWVRS